MALSVIVITKNEAHAIRGCLASVRWADEIVVVDSGSSDGTREICRELGARVTVTDDWPGFGPQKNRALALATCDWVLALDADEEVSDGLRKEIERAMANPGGASAFRIPRSSSYCGRFMRHGGWWPDYTTRLFRKGTARFSDDVVHERVVVTGSTGDLAQPLVHHTYANLEEVLAKVDSYSSAGARQLHARKRKGGLGRAVLHGSWAFFRTYVLRRGFLDGAEGFMLAVSNAEETYYRYLKLWLLQR